MSSPAPGSDPNSPQGSQPGWGAPQEPAQGYGTQGPTPGYGAQSGPQGYGTPGYGAPAPSYSGAPAGTGGPAGNRPGQVTAAAVIGVVIGGLVTLFTLLGLLAAGSLDIEFTTADVVLGLVGVSPGSWREGPVSLVRVRSA